MTINVAAIENNTIVNMVVVSSWEEWRDFLQSVFPQYEWIPETDLPEGAWIGWYRVDGVWIDPDPPQAAARLEASKNASLE